MESKTHQEWVWLTAKFSLQLYRKRIACNNGSHTQWVWGMRSNAFSNWSHVDWLGKPPCSLKNPPENKEPVQCSVTNPIVPLQPKVRLTDGLFSPVFWHRPSREAEEWDPPKFGTHTPVALLGKGDSPPYLPIQGHCPQLPHPTTSRVLRNSLQTSPTEGLCHQVVWPPQCVKVTSKSAHALPDPASSAVGVSGGMRRFSKYSFHHWLYPQLRSPSLLSLQCG